MADYIMLDAIQLPKDLEWVDEFAWDKVPQVIGYSASGSMFIQEGAKQAGRVITLSGKEDMGWITRETALLLLAKKEQAGLVMTLVLYDDRSFNVMFRQGEIAVELSNVKGFDELTAGAWFKVNALRFMEVV